MAVPSPDNTPCDVQNFSSDLIGDNAILPSEEIPAIKSSKIVQEDQEQQQCLSTQETDEQEELAPISGHDEFYPSKGELAESSEDNPVNEEGNNDLDTDDSQEAATNSPSTSLSPDPDSPSSVTNHSFEEKNDMSDNDEKNDSRGGGFLQRVTQRANTNTSTIALEKDDKQRMIKRG